MLRQAKTRSLILAGGSIGIVLVGFASWYAGLQYARMESQQVVSALVEAQRNASSFRVRLDQSATRLGELRSSLAPGGAQKSATQIDSLRQQSLHQQAELNTYQTLAERDKRGFAQNARLLNLFSRPGVRLLALQSAIPGAAAIAYALWIENSTLAFISSNLPKPPPAQQYQLWILRNNDPKVVKGGVVDPDDAGRAVVEFDRGEFVSEFAGVTVTQEPAAGSNSPSGTKIFITPATE